MKTKGYKYQGETFTVIDMEDCYIDVVDEKNTVAIQVNEGESSLYRITLKATGTQWSYNTPQEALDQACDVLIKYREVANLSYQDACKALQEYLEQLPDIQ